MASETTVGNIVGFLRLDITDWNRKVAEARAAAEGLGVVNPDLHIDTNADSVAAELAVVAAEADTASDSGDRMGRSFNRAGNQGSGGIMGLLKAIAPILPATVPLSGAAAGAGLAFGAMGLVGKLAFEGIKQAIAEGSTTGVVFKDLLTQLQGHLSVLEQVAASGVLNGFEDAVKTVNSNINPLTVEVGRLSTALSGILSTSVHGVVSLLVKLGPVFDVVASGAQHVATEFDNWASSGAASQFVSYMLQSLPQLGDFLSGLVTTALHLVEAFAPLGSAILPPLNAILGLLSKIPTGVLASLATGALAAYGAFRLLGGLSSGLQAFGNAVGNISARLTGIGVGFIGLGQKIASIRGPITAAIAVITIAAGALLFWKHRADEAKQEQLQLTQALQQSNGAFDKNAQGILENSSAFKSAQQALAPFKVSQQELLDAAKGVPGAYQDINAQIKRYGTVSMTTNGAQVALGRSTRGLSQNAKDATRAVDTLVGGVNKSVAAYKNGKAEAAAYRSRIGQVTGVMSDAKAATLANVSATSKYKKQVDALNQSLQDEISKNLQLAGGVTAMDAARLSLIKTLKKDTSTTNGNTSAGVRNRQAIENAVGSLQQYRQTQIKNGASTDQATATYDRNGQALLRQVKKVDGANSATYKYTARLLRIPKSVSTRINLPGYERAQAEARNMRAAVRNIPGAKDIHITASTAQARASLSYVQSLVSQIHGKSVVIGVHYETVGGMPVAHGGRIATRAEGSLTTGGVRRMAQGGVLDGGAAIASGGSSILWAETSADEAYIPINGSSRSKAILQETANRFGMSTVPMTVGTNIAPAVPGPAVAVPVNVTFTDDQMRALGAVLGANVYHGAAQHDREVAVALQVASRGSGRSGLVGA